MAEAIRLNDGPEFAYTWTEPTAPEQSGGLFGAIGDVGRSLQKGAYDVGKGLAGVADVLVDEPAATPTFREWGQAAEAGSQAALSKMSPAAQRNVGASVLPGGDNSLWNKDRSALAGIGLKITSAAPSLVATLLGSVFGGVPGATAAAAATGGAGDIYSDVRDHVLDMPSDELAQKVPIYNGLLDMGLSEQDAKHYVIRELAANKTLLMATFSAATSRLSGTVESRIAGLTSKGTGSAANESFKGAVGRSALVETGQEGAEQGLQNILTQQGKGEVTPAPFDWHSLANDVAEAMVVAGPLGAGTAAATHRRAGVTHGAVDPAIDAALNPAPTVAPTAAPVTPEVAPAVPPVPTPAGHELAATDDLRKETGSSSAVLQPAEPAAATTTAPSGLAQDEQAALSYIYDPELGENPDAGIQPDVVPAADVPAGPPTLPRVPVVASPLAEAIGAEPLRPSPQPVAERTATLAPLGLAEIGNAGRGIVDGMYDMLWGKIEKGDTIEAGKPSPFLQVANRIREAGGPLTRETLPQLGSEVQAVLDAHPNRGPAYQDALRAIVANHTQGVQVETSPTEAPTAPPTVAPAEVAPEPVETTPAPALAAPAPTGRVLEGGELVERKPKKVALRERVAELQAANPELSVGDAVKQATKEQSETLVKKTRYNEPRMGKLKKAQIEAGATEVLPAKELAKRARKEGLEGLAQRVRAAQEAIPEPPTLADPPQKLRAYARQLAEQSQIGDVSLANLPADVDPALRLVKAAVQIGKGAGAAAQARDFLVNDLDLRKGGKAITEYAQAQTTSGVSLNEDVGSTETGTGAVANEPERAMVDVLTKRMRRADVFQARETRDLKRARQSKPASAQEATAVASTVGATAGQDRAGKFVVERGRRKLTPPGKDAGTAKRISGQATAKTEAEAAQALTQARLVENQDVLARRPEDEAAARELNKVLGERHHTTTTLGQILTPGKWHEDLTGLPRLLAVEMAGRLRKLAKDVPVHVVDTQTFQREWQKIDPGDERAMPEAFYNITTDEIIVRFDKLNPRVVIHEGTHAAYHRAIEDDPKVRAEIRKLMAAAERQYVEEQRRDGKTGDTTLPYAFDNEHEFVAEAFSNEKIQELLRRTPATEITTQMPRGLTGWAQLIRNIKATLFGKGGPSEHVLSQIVAVTARIDEAATRARGGGPMLALASRPSGSRIVNVQNYVQNLAQDKAEGGRMWWRNLGLKGGALDQIVRQYRGYFPSANGDPLERLLAAMQKQDVFVRGKIAEGHQHVQAWLEAAQKSPEEAHRIARFVTEATMANVNPEPGGDNSHLGRDAARWYQSKAHLARLQAEFAGFKPEFQKLILDTSRYFRDAQNERVRAHIANILNAHDATLSPQAYSQITRNTMNGTLTEDDAGIIDSDAVFKYLQQATGLRVIKGMYFPLLRHGNRIVRTLDHIGDTKGGKVVETDKDGNVIVEWRAPTDKAARAAYKSFADDNKSIVTSVGKRRYLPDGTVVSEADSRGQTHDVAYRARVQLRGFHAFDSKRQAMAFIRDEGPSYADYDRKSLNKIERQRTGELTNQTAQALISSLSGRKDISESDKKLLIGTIKETAAVSMSGNRIQQRAIPRRNVVGGSLDIPRNIVQYASASSHALGKLRFMPEVRAALNDMERIIKEQGFVHTDLHQARSDIHQEMVSRVDQNVVDPRENPQWVKDIMTLSFFDKLGSVSHSMVNGMQVGMVTGPVLGGTYGNLRAANEITRGYNDVAGLKTIGSGIWNTAVAVKGLAQGTIGLDTTDVIGSIRKRLAEKADGAGLVRMYDQLVEHGLTSTDAGLEIAGSIAAGRGKAGRVLANTDRMFRQLPNAIEAINRAVTAVAAYRLGRSAGMSEEQATTHAFDIVNQTQGDYRVFNQPRYFNKPWLAPALQFKKYAQLMTALMADMLHRARFETGRERRIAMKQFANFLGVQVAIAGAMSLPGLELLKVGFMLAGMLGVGDGWDDIERKWRKLFNDSLGKTWGELVTRGVISRAINVDLSSRLSMSDMWTFGQPKSFETDQIKAYLANLILGAPGGLLVEWAEAARHAGNLEFQDALIKAVPAKFIADTAKAVKGITSQGKPISNVEAAMQVVGLRSGRLAEEGEQIGAKIDVSKKLEAERKQLGRDYTEASSQGELLRIKSRIIAHNTRAKETGNMRQTVYLKTLDRVRTENAEKRRRIRGD